MANSSISLDDVKWVEPGADEEPHRILGNESRVREKLKLALI